ncbi:putative Ig domain-containing protein [Nanoarchaeota archaeon]
MKKILFFLILVLSLVFVSENVLAATVTLDSTQINPGDSITCTYQTDEAYEAYLYYFNWYKNGEGTAFITESPEDGYAQYPQSTINSGFDAGDTIICRPYHFVGDEWTGDQSPQVIVAGTPVNGQVRITPAQPGTTDDLTATLVGEVDAYLFYFDWYKDGELQFRLTGTDVQSNSLGVYTVVSTSLTAKNDLWSVNVYDIWDEPAGSTSVLIYNSNPVITTTPITVGTVGVPYIYDVDATDADNDPIDYAYLPCPTGMTCIPSNTLDSNTGSINWTPATAGDYLVRVRVADFDTGIDIQVFNITVTGNGTIDTPPTVNLEGPADNTITNNPNINFNYNVSDDNGVVLTELMINGVLILNDTSVTRNITQTFNLGLPNGTYTWYVNATDTIGQVSSSPVYNLVVNLSNGTNFPPVLNSIGNQTVDEGDVLTFSITATDPENDTLTYDVVSLPSGATFVGQTFTWDTDYTDSGSYIVTFNVTDGLNWDSETITITVDNVDVNHPIFDSTPITDAWIGELYRYNVDADDPAGCEIRYKLIEYPDGMEINSHNGRIEWTPKEEGDVDVRVRARSDCSGNAYQSFEIDVDEGEIEGSNLFIKHAQVLDGAEVNAGEEMKTWVVVENNAPATFDNLVITVSIDDLGIRTTKGPFDLGNGDQNAETLYLDIPTDIEEGWYDVRVVVSNEDVHRVKYREVYVHSAYTTSDDVGVVYQTSTYTNDFEGNVTNLNWLGILFVILFGILLAGAITYAVLKLKERKEQLEVEPEVFTNF